MLKTRMFVAVLMALSAAAQAQPNAEVKFVDATLIVQAEGSYETTFATGAATIR